MYQLFTQPLSVFNVLRNSFSLYKASFFRLLPFNIVFILFSLISSYLISIVNVENNDFNMKHFGLFFAVNAIIYWIYLIMLKIGQQVMFEDKTSYSEALKVSIRKWFFCFSGKIVFTVIILVGGMLLFFPGIYMFVALSFLTLNILFSEESVLDDIKQSIRVVLDHWWRILILLGTVLLLGVALLSLERNILIPNSDLVIFLKDIGRSFSLVYTHWAIVAVGLILAIVSSLSVSKAMKQSFRLVSGHWWKTFVVLGVFVWALVISLIFLTDQFYRSELVMTFIADKTTRTIASWLLKGFEIGIVVPWILAVYLTQRHNLTCSLKQKEARESLYS